MANPETQIVSRETVAAKGRQQRFGQRLREAMAAKPLTNPQVAQALGVHHITVSKWRTGSQPIEGYRIPALAELLGVAELWLREGEGPKAPNDGAQSDEHVANPSLRLRLPPAAYEFVYKKLKLLDDKGLEEEQILKAEQVFLNDDFAALNKKRREPMTDADWLIKVKADWRAIEAYLFGDDR